MALFLDGPLPLENTISFTQQVPLPSNNKLTAMFPSRQYGTDEIDMAVITQTNRTAQFRNWDGGFWVAPRDTGLTKRVPLIPLGAKSNGVGEWERRQKEYARVGGTIQSVLTDAIYDDLGNLTRYIHNRIELAWGDVLADGVLTINENGVQQQVDYGIPSNQKVTAGTLWDASSGSPNPLTDLIAWYDVYVAKNGNGPGQLLTSLKVARLLQTNTALINAIKGSQTGVTHVTLDDISGLFASYGLPPVSMASVYNSNMEVGTTTTKVLDENKLFFLPDDLGTLGFTAWGTPTTVLELNRNNVQVNQGAGVIGILTREQQPPYLSQTFVDAVALPVLADPRKLLVATVGS